MAAHHFARVVLHDSVRLCVCALTMVRDDVPRHWLAVVLGRVGRGCGLGIGGRSGLGLRGGCKGVGLAHDLTPS